MKVWMSKTWKAIFVSLLVFCSFGPPDVSAFDIRDWVPFSEHDYYAQVPIPLDMFQGQGADYEMVPDDFYYAIENGIVELYRQNPKIKCKAIKYKGVSLTPYPDHREAINDFYNSVRREQKEFLTEFCDDWDVDFLIMWAPNSARIVSGSDEIRVRLYMYWPEPQIIQTRILTLPLFDSQETQRIIVENMLDPESVF